MSRLSNALQAAAILSHRGKVNASELSELLEISKKSVYRIIDDLSVAGLPVYSIPGRDGGYSLLDSSDFFTGVTNEELAAIFFAGEILAKQDGFPYEAQVRSGLAKVEKAMRSKSQHEAVASYRQRLYYCKESFLLANLRRIVLATVNEALLNNEIIRIQYFTMSRQEEREREVAPYKLVYRNGFWYLIGYCCWREEIKIFRVDRILKSEMTGKHFTYPSDFSLGEYLGSSWGIERGDEMRVKVRFFARVALLLKEVNWHPSQNIEELENGDIIFTATLQGATEFLQWLLGFGSGAELLEPPELRKRMQEEAAGLSSVYSV